MTTSYEQIQTIVLDRLSTIFDPPQPKVLGGQANPKYAATVQIYLEALQPFQPWELEAGTKLALESHKYQRWPKPAEIRGYCFEAKELAKPPSPKLTNAPKIEDQREPQSPEDRERLSIQFKLLAANFQNPSFTLEMCRDQARKMLQERIANRMKESS